MMNKNKNCTDSGVISEQEMLAGDQLSSTDEELIIHYLNKKRIEQRFPNHTVLEIDFFSYHPQQLSQMHRSSQENEWYFLSPTSTKYSEGDLSYRDNKDGYWKPFGTESLIHRHGRMIGYQNTLNFVDGKDKKNGKTTEWLMQEYRLDNNRDSRTSVTSDQMQWVFCKLFKSKKTIAAGEKEAVKTVGPIDGVSIMDPTTQEKFISSQFLDRSGIYNSGGPNANVQSQGTMLPPLPQHDGGSMLPALSYKRPSHTGSSGPLPMTVRPRYSTKLLDQVCQFSGIDSAHTHPRPQNIFPTPKPQHHLGTILPAPSDKVMSMPLSAPKLLDQQHGSFSIRAPDANCQPVHEEPTNLPPTDPHKAKKGVSTDNVSSDSPNANAQRQLNQGTILPSQPQQFQQTISPHPQHDQPTMLPPTCVHEPKDDEVKGVEKTSIDGVTGVQKAKDGITSVQKINDGEVSNKGPGNNHHLPSSVQDPQLPSPQGLPEGSHGNEEAIVAPRYGGWPLYPLGTALPSFREPFESLSEEDLAFFDNPDPDYPQASANEKEAKK